MFRVVCLLFFIVCYVSCKEKKHTSLVIDQNSYSQSKMSNINNLDVSNIRLNPYSKGYFYDDLIDSISFVKLETTNDNLIGRINYLYFANDKIIVIDSERTKTITVYDKNGKFLYKISNRGQGPDEYRTLDYATLSFDKSQIVILDMGSMKLKYFMIDDVVANMTGSFLYKSLSLPYTLGCIEFLTDQIFAGYYSGGNQIADVADRQLFLITDFDKNVYYSKYKSFYSRSFSYTTEFPLHKFGSNVYFNKPFNDTIFLVSEDGLNMKYILDIKGGEDICIDETTIDTEFSKQLDHMNYFNSYFVDLKDVAVFHYMGHTDFSNWGLYVKADDKTYDCNGKCKNPLFSCFHIPWFYYEDNTVVVPVSSNWIISHKDELLKKCNYELLDSLFKGITEDDNPVLFFFHMKTEIIKDYV